MNIEATREQMRVDFSDWHYAIEVACRDGINPVIGSSTRTDPFTVTDIAEVLGSVEGQNEGDQWLAVVRLHDGRFVSIRAWCDFTGWG